ncbi:MAG: hypothetical protein NZ849_01575 [Meiothermus sp.]|uniref:hypothetical protein n=1 Tax=Meiothermus sp. TaxID=1955249 RepID=UPI0025DD78A4|nr:hypothetical protein [Meiothermus sp.]MCS7057399.1 hypothetical protein [Meiothermus sp.]MCS7193597.1 hypothetical protein [Meiothermus sp.]MCX7740367.1 hypothetical protein [Meiothermus sp.]MDW8090610.1 hypothetical protein [Meiothermus sp.]
MTPVEWIRQMVEANREALQQMPFPPGLAEYIDELVKAGQTEQIIAMMKMSFLIGVQQGARSEEVSLPPRVRIQA